MYDGVPFADYLSWDAVDKSLLWGFRGPAAKGHDLMVSGGKAATPAMDEGTALHCLLFNHDGFDAIFATMPDFPGHHNSNAYKALKAEWLSRNMDKVTLATDQMEDVMSMYAALQDRPGSIAHRLLFSGDDPHNEVSVVAVDPETGTTMKGRFDRTAIIELPGATERRVIVDLKTTVDASEFGFPGEIGKYGYNWQHALYVDLLSWLDPDSRPAQFVFVAVEKPDRKNGVRPLVACHEADAEAVCNGRASYKEALAKLLHGRATGEWPGYPDKLFIASLPTWMLRRSES